MGDDPQAGTTTPSAGWKPTPLNEDLQAVADLGFGITDPDAILDGLDAVAFVAWKKTGKIAVNYKPSTRVRRPLLSGRRLTARRAPRSRRRTTQARARAPTRSADDSEPSLAARLLAILVGLAR